MSSFDDFDDRELSLCLCRATEAAALASAELLGRGDEEAVADAAIAGMHAALGRLKVKGTVVIGEGLPGDVPSLYVGEELGRGEGPEADLALEALEGTSLAAKSQPDALAIAALGPRNSMLQVPDIYMDKLAFGPEYPADLLSLDMSTGDRIKTLAKAKSVAESEITVCVLDRPRHQTLISEIRDVGARIRLISDGDVAGVIHCADPEATGIDIYMGTGGAPEGILAAAALKCLGGNIQGRLIAQNSDQASLIRMSGIDDSSRIFTRDDMITADVIFSASGVTDGAFLRGIRRSKGYLQCETLLMRSRTGSIRRTTYQRRA